MATGMDPRPFISGTAAGVIAGFVGHPLDTIRVRVQTHPGLSGSAIAIARDLIKKEGARALFKGLVPQMIGYCSHSAIRFGVFGNTKSSNAKPLVARERYYRSATYPCRSATYPWDDSLPIGAEYPRHVRGVTEIGTSDLVRGVSEEGIEELDDGNQFYEYTDEYRYRREVLDKQDREAKM